MIFKFSLTACVIMLSIDAMVAGFSTWEMHKISVSGVEKRLLFFYKIILVLFEKFSIFLKL